MKCERIVVNGRAMLVGVKPGCTLTDEDRRILAEYFEFCRERKRLKQSRLRGRAGKK